VKLEEHMEHSQNDWRYSDDRMALRADAFVKLKKHFTLKEGRHLYEFCHHWVSQGNKTLDNIEEEFQKYLELNK